MSADADRGLLPADDEAEADPGPLFVPVPVVLERRAVRAGAGPCCLLTEELRVLPAASCITRPGGGAQVSRGRGAVLEVAFVMSSSGKATDNEGRPEGGETRPAAAAEWSAVAAAALTTPPGGDVGRETARPDWPARGAGVAGSRGT